MLKNFIVPPIAYCIFTYKLKTHPLLPSQAKFIKVPVLPSVTPNNKFLTSLLFFLTSIFDLKKTFYAFLFEFHSIGILILTKSRIAKNEGLRELLDDTHRLLLYNLVKIPILNKKSIRNSWMQTIYINHFLEIKELSIIDIKHLFGSRSCFQNKNMNLVVRLNLDTDKMPYIRYDYPKSKCTYKLWRIFIPLLNIFIKPYNHIPVILKTSTLHVQQFGGQDSILIVKKRLKCLFLD